MTDTRSCVIARIPIHHLTRRATMRGIVGGGLATALGSALGIDLEEAVTQSDAATPVATPEQPVALTDAALRDFEADVEAAMQTFRVPGAAVAYVASDPPVARLPVSMREDERGAPNLVVPNPAGGSEYVFTAEVEATPTVASQ